MAIDLSGQKRINATCDHFEQEWQAGARPDLKRFLDGFAGEERTCLLEELLRLDWHYRQANGETPTSREYETRLPGETQTIQRAFAAEIQSKADTFKEEWQVGGRPDLARFLDGFAGEERSRLVEELIRLDLHYRRANGETPTSREYETRLPGEKKAIHKVFVAETSTVLVELQSQTTTNYEPGSEMPVPGTPSSSSRVGQQFGDNQLLALLGEGGMGEVYRARKHSLDIEVAVKVIKEARLARAQERDRFKDDAKTAAQLNHPNIVHIYEVGEKEGQPFFAMEFCASGSLDDELKDKFLTPMQAAKLVEWLAGAMHLAHQKGIVHRDLKPANILLTKTDAVSGICVVADDGTEAHYQPKITDFGLARRLDRECDKQANVIMGTPSYMAPEQARGESNQVTARADVYGLGAILYECLTGSPPFKGATPMETIKQVQHRDPVPVRRLQPKVPRDLVTICDKCLEKDPQRRYEDAEKLAEDLRRFQNQEPIEARPISRAERLWRRARRNPGAAAAIVLAGVSLLTLGLAVLSSLFSLQKDEATAERCLERGQALCGRGKVAHGLLWMGRGLKKVPWYAEDVQDELRLSLAGWMQQVNPLQTVLDYKSAVWTVGFSPDGKIVAYAGIRGNVRFWDNVNDRALEQELPPTDKVSTLAFSPVDNHLLATGHWDGTVRIWDTRRCVQLHQIIVNNDLRTTYPIRALAFSPHGEKLVIGGEDRRAYLCDVNTGEPLGTPWPHEGGEVWAVAFSPDGHTVLTGCQDGMARLWEVSSQGKGTPLRTFRHDASVSSVAFGPEGKIVTGSLDGTARVWDVETEQVVGEPLFHSEQVWAVAWNASQNVIVTGCRDGAARIWDVRTRELRGSLLRHQDVVWAVAISPQGDRVLTGSEDHSARLWEIGSGAQVLAHLGGPVETLAFHPPQVGRTLIAGCSDGKLHRWNTGTGKAVGDPLEHEPGDQVTVVRCSPDGSLLLSGGRSGKAYLHDASTGKRVGTPLTHEDEILDAAFSPNSQIVATGSRDGTARLWNARTGKPHTNPDGKRIDPLQHGDRVTALAFSPDGTMLLTGSGDEVARLWDTATGKPIASLPHGSWIYAVAFHPDGKRVVTAGGGKEGRAQQWDVSTQKPVGPSLQHQGAVYAVAYSPDGNTILTCGGDWTARLWDAQTGEPIGTPCHHEGAVRAIAFRPDSQQIVTGGTDGVVRVWDAQTGKIAATGSPHRGAIRAVAFSPDGKWVAVSSSDGTVRLWKPPPPVQGSPEEIVRNIEVLTGMELDDEGVVHVLDAEGWEERRQ
jgi:WD40 repeat protein/tRNA A-37 threonylcarbamoyl transferase component Bud32